MRITIITCCLICLSQWACGQPNPTTNDKAQNKASPYRYHKASADGIGKFYFNREIALVMGAAGSEWLERTERQKEENSQLAIEKMLLKPHSIVADIGAGTGYYSFKIAQKTPRGKVYAVEIQDAMIQYLQQKKLDVRDSIVAIVKSNNQSVNLPDTSIDLALMVDVYHELAFPAEILQSIRKALKPTGLLLLIEYRAEDPTIPIKPLHKTSIVQLNKELRANGFSLYYDGEFLPIQHFLLYKKK
jgi:ubiquinone/menaquinone biosynthesis C-methylase UbiE